MSWRDHWSIIFVTILALPIVSAILFWLWIRSRTNIDIKTAVSCWDVFIKLVSALTVVVTGAMVFGKYVEQRADADKAASKQASRELALREADVLGQKLAFDKQRHEKKQRLLGEVKTVTARIASTPEPDRASLTRFNELYQADLIGVETFHGPVEAAMVRFRTKLRHEPDAPDETLEDLSLQLSTAVERELKESEDALLEQHRAIAALVTAPERGMMKDER
jgi:hypothetical protein